MRSRPTALILGAGASKVFGLPLGSELRVQIARDLNIRFKDFGNSLLSGSYEIVEALRLLTRSPDAHSTDINLYRKAAVQISEAMALSGSIDEYIERHSENKIKSQCAKIAITKAILEAERRSNIFRNQSQSSSIFSVKSSETWLAYFLRDITRGHTRNNLPLAFKNVTIINFNYDRCFEHFCLNWLQQIYEISEEHAGEIIKSLNVFHPYGSIAPLPFEKSSQSLAYGGEFDAHRLVKMATEIRTYSETIEDNEKILTVMESLEAVRSVVFMGFGFHQQNLDILKLPISEKRTSL